MEIRASTAICSRVEPACDDPERHLQQDQLPNNERIPRFRIFVRRTQKPHKLLSNRLHGSQPRPIDLSPFKHKKLLKSSVDWGN